MASTPSLRAARLSAPDDAALAETGHLLDVYDTRKNVGVGGVNFPRSCLFRETSLKTLGRATRPPHRFTETIDDPSVEAPAQLGRAPLVDCCHQKPQDKVNF